MIIRACCCCTAELGPPIDDGKDEVSVSHGFCQKHYDEQMANIESQFAELSADMRREVAA